MRTKPFLALASLAALCALPACGDDDDSSDGGASATSEPAAVVFETTEPSKRRVSIDAPASIDAGVVELSLKNSGKRTHDGQLVRVDGDQSAQDVIDKVIDSGEGAGIPDWAHGGGGVGVVAPGETVTVTEVLEPGTYYLLDTESAGENGPLNARNGGVAKFEVTGDGGGELPATDATITADEYSFESSGIKAGKNRLTFENVGKELHHILALPVREGAKFSDVTKALTSEAPPKGPPPVDFEAFQGTAVIDGGEKQVTELDLEPGKYALVCFIADRAGGPPHAAKGMVSELDVR